MRKIKLLKKTTAAIICAALIITESCCPIYADEAENADNEANTVYQADGEADSQTGSEADSQADETAGMEDTGEAAGETAELSDEASAEDENVQEEVIEEESGDEEIISDGDEKSSDDDEIISEDEETVSDEDEVITEDGIAGDETADSDGVTIMTEKTERANKTGAAVEGIEEEEPDLAVSSSVDKLLSTDVTEIDGSTVPVNEIPHGHAANVPFMLSEEDELLYTISDGEGDSDSNSQSFYKSINGSGQSVYAISDDMLDIQSVAFDPTDPSDEEHGRKKYVGYVGVKYDSDKEYYAYVWVENIKTGAVSDLYKLGKTWFNKDDSLIGDYYKSNNFIQITAGDYNDDEKDTLVVYAPLYDCDGALNLIEMSVDVSGNSISLSVKNKDDDLLHPTYRAANIDYWDEDSHLGVDLATGDANRDGIDDLAVTSYYADADERGKNRAVDLFIPVISVSKGSKSDSYNILTTNGSNTSSMQIKDAGKQDGKQTAFNTSLFPAVTFADTNADGYDEIITAGYKTQVLAKKGDDTIIDNARHNITNKTICVAAFSDYDDSGIKAMSEASTIISEVDSNGWTRYETSTSDTIMPKPMTQGYAPNGTISAEQVFISGTIYSFTGYAAQAKYTPDYFTSGDKGAGGAIVNAAGIVQVQAGNFTNNTVGREQIVYSIALKQQTFHDYHCFIGMIGADYSDVMDGEKVKSYGDVKDYTSKRTTDYLVDGHKNCTDSPVNLLVTSVDCDNDGVMAKFKSKYDFMSDVTVDCVLQAHPYYSDFETTEGTTEYKITETNINSTSSGVENDLSIGTVIDGEVCAGAASVEADFEAGVKMHFDNEWEKEYRYSSSKLFEATDRDEVVVSRRPIHAYTYTLYDNENNRWNDDSDNNGNDVVITVNDEPGYTELSIDEYNSFVDQYNAKAASGIEYLKTLGIDTSKYTIASLNKISDTHLSQEGKPYNYYHENQGTDVGLNTFGGDEWVSETNNTGIIEEYMSTSSSSSHTFSYEIGVEAGLTVTAGVTTPFGKSMVGGYVRGGVSGSHSSTSGHEEETEVGCGMKGFGGDEIIEKTGMSEEIFEQFEFDWKPCTWIFKPELDNDKKTIPVIGYVVKEQTGGERAPSETVSSLTAAEITKDEKAAVSLTWTNPAADTDHARMEMTGYRIYVKPGNSYEAGGYTSLTDITISDENTAITGAVITKEAIETALKDVSHDPANGYIFTVTTLCADNGSTYSTGESVYSNSASIVLKDLKKTTYTTNGNGKVSVQSSDGKSVASGEEVPEGNYTIALKAGKNSTTDALQKGDSYIKELKVSGISDEIDKKYTAYETEATESIEINENASDVSITAVFGKISLYDIDVKVSGKGKIRVTDVSEGNKKIYEGVSKNLQDVAIESHTVKIEVIPDEHNSVTSFKVNDTEYSADEGCTVKVTENLYAAAQFTHKTCSINIEHHPNGELTVTASGNAASGGVSSDGASEDDIRLYGAGSYVLNENSTINVLKGQTVSVAAIPNKGYFFTGYFLNGSRMERGDTFTASDDTASLKGEFEKISITLAKSKYPYTGKEIVPKVTVTAGTTVLTENKDYVVGCRDNKEFGTAKLYVTGTGKYFGQISTEFKIVPAATASLKAANTEKGVKLSWKKVTGADGYYVYRGKDKIAKLKGNANVSLIDKKAKTNGSKYTYKVYAYNESGTGVGSSAVVCYYLTKMKTPKLASPAKGKAALTWTKNTAASGYEIMYAYDSKFKSPVTIKIKSNATVGKTINNLKTGKKIYVKIRSYKTVGKVTYYSVWSNVKSVTVRKTDKKTFVEKIEFPQIPKEGREYWPKWLTDLLDEYGL